jgi:hypothetical protein
MKEVDVVQQPINNDQLIKDQQEYEKKLKESILDDGTGFTQSISGMLDEKLTEDFTTSKPYNVVHGEMFSKQYYPDLVFSDSDLKYYNGINDKKIQDVIDYNNFKHYKKQMGVAADMMDKIINDNVINQDEVNQTTKEFLKSCSSKPLYRAQKGYNSYYVGYKNPLGTGNTSLLACFVTNIEDDKLQKNIKKYQSKFPAHQMIIDSENQLQTLADYWEEKDKAKGKLKPEREKEYRQKLYDQTLIISAEYSKSMKFLEKKENCVALHNDEVIDKKNDPWHLHPKAARGTKPFLSGLTAMKTGLENGWAIDDIGMLAAFYGIICGEKIKASCNGGITFDEFKEYPEPNYGSKEKKEYIEKLEKHWKKIEETKLSSIKDRQKLLDDADELIREGIKEKYLTEVQNGKVVPNGYTQYYIQTYKQRPVRDLEISKGNDPGFYAGKDNVITDNRTRINLFAADLNAPRTDFRFSDENEEHKNIRIAVEKLQGFKEKKPAPKDDADKDVILQHAAEYLGKLDAVQYYSKIYRDIKKNKANTLAGKKRLNGAVEASKYAIVEKQELMDHLKELGVIRADETLEGFRRKVALQKMSNAYNEIANMQEMPGTPAEKKALMDKTADIMVARMIGSAESSGFKAVNSMGTEILKNQILNDKTFKKMVNDCLKDNTMTPQKFANEMMNDGAINRLKTINSNLKKVETNMNAEEAKKAEASRKVEAARKAEVARRVEAENKAKAARQAKLAKGK